MLMADLLVMLLKTFLGTIRPGLTSAGPCFPGGTILHLFLLFYLAVTDQAMGIGLHLLGPNSFDPCNIKCDHTKKTEGQ
jgi:hypothetical protein